MNAAFLLVTSAWLAGDVPAAPAPNACGGGNCCDTCNDGFGHRLRGKLRGLFNRGGDCCEAPKCDAGCGSSHRFSGWNHGHSCGHDRCAPANSCDSCDDGGKLLGRLRGLFNRGGRHHGSDDGCCGNSCGNTGGVITPKAGEVIPIPPKKMPNPGGKEPPTKEVRIDNQPDFVPVVPSIQPPVVTPGADPAIDNRNPF